ncbi:MAG: CHAT domain-containing protein [Gammaproteobacteria bacterium]|nr:CHAT domain-containing protein [Gammaproteobacteria bacterium]
MPWEIARPKPEAETLGERNLLVRVVHDTARPAAAPLTLAPNEDLRVLFVFAEARGSLPLGSRRERRALLRLVVLSACHSGDILRVRDWEDFLAIAAGRTPKPEPPPAGTTDRQGGGPTPVPLRDLDLAEPPGYTGTAHALLQGGVPTVVAMRYAVGDDYARKLGLALYRALLADARPKDAAAALTLARRALLVGGAPGPGAGLVGRPQARPARPRGARTRAPGPGPDQRPRYRPPGRLRPRGLGLGPGAAGRDPCGPAGPETPGRGPRRHSAQPLQRAGETAGPPRRGQGRAGGLPRTLRRQPRHAGQGPGLPHRPRLRRPGAVAAPAPHRPGGVAGGHRRLPRSGAGRGVGAQRTKEWFNNN